MMYRSGCRLDPSVCMITSGTPTVLGFTEEMRKRPAGRVYRRRHRRGERSCAGIRHCGKRRQAGLRRARSTFIQRAHDQISPGTCASTATRLPLSLRGVRFYGMNDVTHLGLY
ncbi:MAG: hypothetical protein ACLR4Z_15290 [Butyricicoccaceae bacterium]